MALHIVKLCVGAETVDDLQNWVKKRSAQNKKAGLGYIHDHVTRMRPRREADLLDGGSLYWVIKGMILARQRIEAIAPREGADGIKRCAIMLDPALVLTEPQPKRAFQGWRYLRAEDAPADLKAGDARQAAPLELRLELAELGLL